MTTNDADWVQDVKRWYFSNGQVEKQPAPIAPAAPLRGDVGYEAAEPTLHSANRTKPKRTQFGTLR